jgi:hypothetical protein
MATPGAAIARPVLQSQSLIPLVERVNNQLDIRNRRDRAEKEAINQQFKEDIDSIDYNGLTTDQISELGNQANALVDLNANLIRNAGNDPRNIDRKPILREQNSIRSLGEKWREFNREISSVSKTVEADKDGIYDKEAINNALMGMTYETGPDGKRKARRDVQSGEAIAMLDNPAFMDPDAYIKREINKLEEKTANEFETQNIPGFGTVGFNTKQTTRIPWKLDANGLPIPNPENGEKMLDIDAWSRMVVDDPNTRKHIQHFAAREGKTVNQWLYEKGLKHNATPKTFEQVYFPRVVRETDSSRRGREAEDVKKTFLDTVSGLLNQSPELVGNSPQADEVDEEGVPYRDVTETLQPYSLTKVNGKAMPFYQVLLKDGLKDGEPGSIYVRETEDSNLREMTEAEITNMVNAAGTLNTALRGIDSYALKKGYVTGQNVFNPDVNINRDPRFLDQRRQLREQTISTAQQTRAQLKDIATKVRSKPWWTAAGSDQQSLADEINASLQGKVIKVKGKFNQTQNVENPTVEVDVRAFRENLIILKDGDGNTVKTMNADDFATLIESNDFIVTEKGLSKTQQQGDAPMTEGELPETADEIGI